MQDLTAEQICKNFRDMQSSRLTMDSLYQKLHHYFFVESNNITETRDKGQELHTLLDSASLDSADVLAAGLANYLTPESSKWFFLEHSNPEYRDNDEVKTWMQDVQAETMAVLSHSNFYNQMPIFYKSSGVYGTAVMFCEKDETDGIRFYNIPIKNIYIAEDARERPSEFYLLMEYTAEQALSRFGDACSREIKESYAAGRHEDKKYKFICYFGKRCVYDKDRRDKLNKPIRMVWVDENTKEIMQEDGFDAMPCVAHRFYKQPQIVYGYSPAMKALPAARMINVLSDTMLRAAMKKADPAIALPDDAFLGTPNLNPRQLNYYQRGSLSPKDDIAPLGNFGDVGVGIEEVEYYKKQLREVMFVDTFQAFNNLTKQMTVPEVMERISEKMTLLGPAVGRFMNDVLQPLIEKVVFILWENGRLPPMPDVMMQAPDFEVKFVGRLVQSQRQSEVNNIVNAMSIAGQLAQFAPEVVDKVNADNALEEVVNITGVTTKILRNDDEVEQIRKQRAAQAQAMEQMQATAGVADIYKTATEGAKNNAQIQSV